MAAVVVFGASALGYAAGHQGSSTPAGVPAASGVDNVDLVGAPPQPPPPVTAPAVVQGPVLAAATPTSITIPSLGVTSVVDQVGLNADNTMEVPQPGPNYDNAAWYRFSPTPGELGPSVIIGHVDSVADGPSVFYDLEKLQPGERIEVGRDDGSTAVFEVETVTSFSKDEFPLQTVYGNTDHAGLRLITCGGSFDSSRRSYQDNIVAFARLLT